MVMGCDIHIHSEVKINGQWHHYSVGNVARNYELFAKMAGVKNCFNITPVSPPKGLPENISLVTKTSRDNTGGDGHHDSWLNIREINEIEKWQDDNLFKHSLSEDLGDLFGNSFGSFLDYREDYPEEIEDVRWVFWFDNYLNFPHIDPPVILPPEHRVTSSSNPFLFSNGLPAIKHFENSLSVSSGNSNLTNNCSWLGFSLKN